MSYSCSQLIVSTGAAENNQGQSMSMQKTYNWRVIGERFDALGILHALDMV